MTLAVRDLDFPERESGAAPARFVAAFPETNPPPFILQVTHENGVVVAQETHVDVYGSGTDDKRAVEDFLKSAHQHLAVLDAAERLSPQLQQQRDYLRERLPA